MKKFLNLPHFLQIILPVFLLYVMGVTVFLAMRSQDTRGRAAASTDCTVSASDISMTSTEQELFNLINQYRAENNLHQLQDSAILRKAAAWLSNDMLAKNYMSHTDSLGRSVTVRLSNCGYVQAGHGEIIQTNPGNPPSVISWWKGSSGHNALMLSSTMKFMGVAQSGKYWTVDFGTTSGENTVPTATPTRIPTHQPSATPTSLPNLTPSPSPTGIRITPTVTGSQPTPTGTMQPTQPPAGPGTASVKVKILFLEANAGISKSLPVTLTFQNINNQVVGVVNGILTYSATANAFSGVVTLPDSVVSGQYFVKIKGNSTLRSNVSETLISINREESVELPETVLTPGDLDGSNSLTLLDYNLLVPCIKTGSCNTEGADLNYDGKNDILDYNLMLLVFKTVLGD